jgi:hypothetical protein
MALRGTLAELGIVDLIQFPHSGRKSGKLMIKANGQEAKLYYDQGALVHVMLGELTGMDALVRVIDWQEGAFEFVSDEMATETSIERDLHRTLMTALKLHDEIKAEDERRKGAKAGGGADEAVKARLEQFMGSNDFTAHAEVLGVDGAIRGQASGKDGYPQGMDALRTSVMELDKAYPRPNLARIIIEDDLGTVVMVRLSDGGRLLVVARRGVSMGAISIGVGRLAAAFE